MTIALPNYSVTMFLLFFAVLFPPVLCCYCSAFAVLLLSITSLIFIKVSPTYPPDRPSTAPTCPPTNMPPTAPSGRKLSISFTVPPTRAPPIACLPACLPALPNFFSLTYAPNVIILAPSHPLAHPFALPHVPTYNTIILPP